MKKIITVLCAFVCILSLTACGNEEVQIEYDKQVLEMDMAIASQLFTVYSEGEAYEEMLGYSEFEWMELSNEIKTNYGVIIEKTTMKSAVESYRSATEAVGVIVETGEVIYEVEGDEAVMTLPLVSETGRQVDFVVTVNEHNEITACQSNVNYTMGEKMGAAGINTLLGMGTVFSVLIVISLLISCFRFIPVIQEKIERKKAGSDESIDQTIAQIAEKEEEELSDDTELVAVIAAAIASYEGATSTDGFTVRSIRKVNASKWKNSLK
jgi:sodium pump decarboxylase gamma subunit